MTVCTAFPRGSKIAAHTSAMAVAIDADDLDVFANMGLPGAAEQTRQVGDVSFHRDALADAHGAYLGADRRDRSHDFMSDDEGRLDPALRPRVPRVDVMIGSAEPRLFDSDQDVAGADVGDRHVGQEEARRRARLH
jgi:hypothetical protein